MTIDTRVRRGQVGRLDGFSEVDIVRSRIDLSKQSEVALLPLLDRSSLGSACSGAGDHRGPRWFSYRLGVSLIRRSVIDLLCSSVSDRFPILVQHNQIYFPVLFSLALFFTVSNYLFASLHDPGVVPRPNADEALKVEEQNNIQVNL